jgi:uncharacterized protein YdhG (YjbR/CyaY superfamily)
MNASRQNVDEYIAAFPRETASMLLQLRETIRAVAPDAEEAISYAMPAYKLNGMLVYFAGYAKHIGFYPGAGGIAVFKDELSAYKWAKGSVQFPLDRPLPIKLITRIVKFRITENLQWAKSKGKIKK